MALDKGEPGALPHERPDTPPLRVDEVLDRAALERRLGRRPTQRDLREALPVGLCLDADGVHVRRDQRLFARHSAVLVIGLVAFGLAGLWLFQETFPSGWRGVLRFVLLISIVALAGGVVGPLVTRALLRRR